MGISRAYSRPIPARTRALQLILLVIVSILSFAAIVLPLALRPAALLLQAGDVAPRDFQATRDTEYVSDVKTEEARAVAEHSVAPVYTPPDSALARKQIERLRDALDYITLIRDDPNITYEQKKSEIASFADLKLDPQTIERILALTPARWDAIRQEALNVLQQVMRTVIRDSDVDTARRTIPSLVSLALSEEQASIVTDLVTSFVIPNSVYSADLTEAARKSAREAVQPIVQRYKQGEIIVSRGQLLTPAHMEALSNLGLIQPRRELQDYLGAAVLTVMMTAYVGLYFSRRRLSFVFDNRSLVVAAIIFIVFLVGARVTIPNRTVLPYAYPLPAAGLLIATLFGVEPGILFSIVLAPLASYGLNNASDLMPYYLFASLCGVMVLGSARRVWSFYRGGMAVAGAAIAMLLAFRIPFVITNAAGVFQLAAAAIFNGVASASLALLLQYLLAQTLGITTPLQLLEISRPDFPLLQYFLRNAPGTYQHSLQVANLAEQAAEQIGADALLTRVGALFHDVGKAENPSFFIENQVAGAKNVHEDLDPAESAAFIIHHVEIGVGMARKYRLPRRIDDFIREHHGTMITRYQYNRALDAAGGDASKVDAEKFRYPGPRPHSRETALLMLADGAEARTRAERPQTEEELRSIIRASIENVQKLGQLDNTQLTFRDLNVITESFFTTLRGTYHPRIVYPKVEEPPAVLESKTKPR